MKYDVFISYRREGGYDTAKHLNDLLVRDGYKVSFDIDKYPVEKGLRELNLLEFIEFCIRNKRYMIREIRDDSNII